jgi:hypothetical protein
MDSGVALRAPRNDGGEYGTFRLNHHRYCERKRSNPGPRVKLWVASSRSLSSGLASRGPVGSLQ